MAVDLETQPKLTLAAPIWPGRPTSYDGLNNPPLTNPAWLNDNHSILGWRPAVSGLVLTESFADAAHIAAEFLRRVHRPAISHAMESVSQKLESAKENRNVMRLVGATTGVGAFVALSLIYIATAGVLP